jgi:hypothetical protein
MDGHRITEYYNYIAAWGHIQGNKTIKEEWPNLVRGDQLWCFQQHILLIMLVI